MEKLTPQNAHQERMVQVLLAVMQGIPVLYKHNWSWRLVGTDYFSLNSEFRIVPQQLPISREVWQTIHKKWKWVAMDKDRNINFFTNKPFIYENDGTWVFNAGDSCRSALAIDTSYILWNLSLTERPEDV